MYFVAFILKNLTRRPIRTALTVLGLAVAVGSMLALLAVSYNVEKSVESAFDRRRVDLVVMQAGKSSGLNSDFSEALVEQAREIREVDKVSEGVVDVTDMTRDSGASDPVLIQGWKPSNFGFEDIQIISGRKLEEGERSKIMLGRTLATNLNKKVGDHIVFGGNKDNPYEVVAVFKSFVVFEEGGAVVSFPDGQALTGKRVTGFSVRVKKTSPDSAAEIEDVRQKIEALRDPKDKTARLSAQTPDAYVTSVSQLKLVRAVAWLVSAIALAIGVISMLNTMAMSVLERTHEIGILRAVGWPPGRVIGMILGEAVLLATVAAIGGTVIAFLGMHLLTLSPKVNGFIEPELAPVVILRGVLITVFIGVLGGAYPAFRASRLLPTEALRHD
ncbi:ABC transporter permease [Gemmata sp. G18]|uniref:ABC transporter permease n=1 Tax=Gemmata palustris TaxID=2822762 RepID=A0ABS5BUR7_9BACT|nr:ABC transporter permease [Gemmata palustris]MBP3957464.1 ABC transporter permease [Gemmata palustris]